MLTGNSDNRGHDVLTCTYNYTRIYSCIYFASFKYLILIMDYKKWVEKVLFAFIDMLRNSYHWCNA